jgi:hypothetical protein
MARDRWRHTGELRLDRLGHRLLPGRGLAIVAHTGCLQLEASNEDDVSGHEEQKL